MSRNDIKPYLLTAGAFIAVVFATIMAINGRLHYRPSIIKLNESQASKSAKEFCVKLTDGYIGFAGYTIGESYHALTSGGKTIYVDVVESYSHQATLATPYHGLKSIDLSLSPVSHCLTSIKTSRINFDNRKDLMDSGLSLLDDLGNHLGMRLSAFEFTAPDSPYWPSRKVGMWSGVLPELLKVDESLWPTAKTIFATSTTRVGKCSVQVKLDVVDYDEYTMSVSIFSSPITEKSKQEFQGAFRAKHNGMTFNDWCADRQYRNSPAFKINERREPFTKQVSVAGWTLDAYVDTNRCHRMFSREPFVCGWDANEKLEKPFLDIYTHIEIGLNGSNRVTNIALRANRIKDAKTAIDWFRKTKEFLVNYGMDDCYEEVLCPADEIERFINPARDVWGGNVMCKLHWVDKTKTLHFAVDMDVKRQVGIDLYFVVRRAEPGKLDYIWQQCMESTGRRRQSQQRPALPQP